MPLPRTCLRGRSAAWGLARGVRRWGVRCTGCSTWTSSAGSSLRSGCSRKWRTLRAGGPWLASPSKGQHCRQRCRLPASRWLRSLDGGPSRCGDRLGPTPAARNPLNHSGRGADGTAPGPTLALPEHYDFIDVWHYPRSCRGRRCPSATERPLVVLRRRSVCWFPSRYDSGINEDHHRGAPAALLAVRRSAVDERDGWLLKFDVHFSSVRCPPCVQLDMKVRICSSGRVSERADTRLFAPAMTCANAAMVVRCGRRDTYVAVL